MSEYVQNSFNGGMNLRDSADALAVNEYVWAVNARTRDQRVGCVRAPVEDTSAPTGKKQGLYALAEYLIIFVAGKAYWKKYTETSWTQISGFQMSRTASALYATLVTGSSVNLQRLRTDAETTIAYKTSGTGLATATGTPAGLLIQDGTNQPWIIFPDLTCRVTQTYDQWIQGTAQEYVPVGTQMAVAGAKLFILSVDGKRIYQSVSGRMLDFVVNVDTAGNKGGNADTTSHAVSGDVVTALKAVSLTNLLVATAKQVWLVELDYTNKTFGEPRFNNNPVVDAGITNEKSVIELLGDYQFIDFNGVRSFNAVMNLKFKGQNAPFSSKISELFKERLQSSDDTAAIAFDNYGIFSVFTTIGHGLLIYDTLLEAWVSIDQHDCIRVKNFAVTTGASTQQLWALTAQGRVFQLFAGTDYLQPMVMTRGFTEASLTVEQQGRSVLTQIEECTGGTLRVIPYVDSKRFGAKSRTLRNTTPALTFPMEYPIAFSNTDRLDIISIPLTKLPIARVLQVVVTWSGGGALNSLMLASENSVSQTPTAQQASNAL